MKVLAIATVLFSILVVASASLPAGQAGEKPAPPSDTPQPAAPPTPEPTKEHQWLEQLTGDWTYESEAVVDPSGGTIKCQGSESVRSFGGMWVIADGKGTSPDGAMMRMIMTLGFEPQKKKYVGSWICDKMENLWVYEGSLDASGKVLTLDTEGPSFADPAKSSRYQDIIEIKDKDHRLLTSLVLGDDGKWSTFATSHYRRNKP